MKDLWIAVGRYRPWVRVRADIASCYETEQMACALGISPAEVVGHVVMFMGGEKNGNSAGTHFDDLPDGLIEFWAHWTGEPGHFGRELRNYGRALLRQPARVALTRALRHAIYARDGFRCRFCGAERELQIDHIHPVSRGGGNEEGNLQTLCRPCNARKSDSTEVFV